MSRRATVKRKPSGSLPKDPLAKYWVYFDPEILKVAWKRELGIAADRETHDKGAQ